MAITQQFIEMDCHIHLLKCHIDNVHVLFEYHGEEGLPSIFKLVKGASSYYLNSDGLIPVSIYWEKGYDCYTVSPNKLNEAIVYINDQLEYHKLISYTEEIARLRKNARVIK